MQVVRNTEFSGHWPYEVNILEMKSFDTSAIYSVPIQKFQQNFQMLDSDFSGLQKYIYGLAKFHLQPWRTYVWLAIWMII